MQRFPCLTMCVADIFSHCWCLKSCVSFTYHSFFFYTYFFKMISPASQFLPDPAAFLPLSNRDWRAEEEHQLRGPGHHDEHPLPGAVPSRRPAVSAAPGGPRSWNSQPLQVYDYFLCLLLLQHSILAGLVYKTTTCTGHTWYRKLYLLRKWLDNKFHPFYCLSHFTKQRYWHGCSTYWAPMDLRTC